MHDPAAVAEVLDLRAAGASASSIASRIGLPRSTVRDWCAGKVPGRTARQRGPRPGEGAPLPASYPYLLGIYLGDGSISTHPRGVFRLRLHLDLDYPRIIDECESALRDAAPANRVHRLTRRSHYTGAPAASYVDLSCYSKWWADLFPQHGRGRKHERRIALADWQVTAVVAAPDRFLRGLIHSDGCRSINTGTNWRYPRYSFSNRSDDIRRLFCWACDLLELHWTTAPHTVYVSRKADVDRMDAFIGPKA